MSAAPTAGTQPDADTLATAIAWRSAGHGVQLVTVVSTWGSAPRPPGSIAAVRDDGAVVGSVSGGCIERELAEHRAPGTAGQGATAIESITVTDDAARRVGLTCGGSLELIFETLQDVEPLQRIVTALTERRRLVRELDLDTDTVRVRDAVPGERFAWNGHRLARPFGPAWRVLLIGAGELSRHVARLSAMLDFEVVICEPRAPFRQAMDLTGITLLDVLPDDAVSSHAADPDSAVLALSHDPQLDDLALEQALDASCFYIGALGSRRSHAKRADRLVAVGVERDAIARIHAPIGLNIGSRTAAEIAISIAAELVQARAQAQA